MSTNPESAGTTQEPTGKPNPEVSQPNPDSPTSGSQGVDTLVAAILQHPDFQKATQSVKDKRIAEIQKDLEVKDTQLARLAQALNIEPNKVVEAQNKIAMEDLLKAYQEGNLVPKQAPPPTPPGSEVEVAKVRDTILQKLNINHAPTGYDDYLATLDWSDPVSASVSAAAWVQGKVKPTTTPASAPPMTGGNVQTGKFADMTVEQLGDQLSEYQRDPRRYAKERAELAAELRRRGQT